MTSGGRGPRLEAAFKATTYRVSTEEGEFALRIGQLDHRFDAFVAALGGGSWGIVTAANPAARRCAEADNVRALQALQDRVGRLGIAFRHTCHHADDGAWPDEKGVLLLNADVNEICCLARDFGQCACVVGSVGHAPELVWIDAS